MEIIKFLIGASVIESKTIGHDHGQECYKKIGCFSNQYPWFQPKKFEPVFPPWEPKKINPEFYFTTDLIQDEYLNWENPDSLFMELFSDKETIITVHGWGDFYDPFLPKNTSEPGKIWMNNAKDAIR